MNAGKPNNIRTKKKVRATEENGENEREREQERREGRGGRSDKGKERLG